MNELNNLGEIYARNLVHRRDETSGRYPTQQSGPRRTTRRQLASGLRRMADRLDG